MDRYILIVLCVFVFNSNLLIAHDTDNVTPEPNGTPATGTTTITLRDNESEYDDATSNNNDEGVDMEQRSIGTSEGSEFSQNNANTDEYEAFRRRAKPLKSIFMGIYKNYKSTYMGNKTIAEYKRTLRTHAQSDQDSNVEERVEEKQETTTTKEETQTSTESVQLATNDRENQLMDVQAEADVIEAKVKSIKRKKKKQRVRKRSHRRKKHGKRHLQGKKETETETSDSPIYNYEFGPGVNMSLDLSSEIVKLHLDGENLQDVMQGRWLRQKSEGRGKKYDMITKVLPLFIIPFLIQSAVVPFLVTKLKLLLMKSILVGKLAIFLLVISAIKNSNKMMQTYEVAPSYWAGEPSRRSELAAAAASSSAAYNGYRVEGKPAAWIN